MKATRIREIVSHVYENVELALWATLIAFVIYFFTFAFPKMHEIQAQNARIRAEEIAAENTSLCEKLSIKRGTDAYAQCLLDVGEFRWKVETRIYNETAW